MHRIKRRECDRQPLGDNYRYCLHETDHQMEDWWVERSMLFLTLIIIATLLKGLFLISLISNNRNTELKEKERKKLFLSSFLTH